MKRGRQAQPHVGALQDLREAIVAGPRDNREEAREEERMLALSLEEVTLEFIVHTKIFLGGKWCCS